MRATSTKGWLLILALALALPATARATSALLFTEAEQARLSTAVVVATVGSARQELHPRWGRPLTFTSIRVERVLSGVAPDELEIEQIAGTREGITSRIPGDAVLEAGSRCVLFLREVDGGWHLTALGQSMYRIVDGPDGPELRRTLTLNLYRRDVTGRLHRVRAPVGPRTLADLERALTADGAERPR